MTGLTIDRATAMFREAAEAPRRVAGQLLANAPAVAALGERLRAAPPRTVVTVARGSSDNAATYARYLIETQLEVLTASLPPSVAAVYGAHPPMADTLCLALSQSGHSPDLLATVDAAQAAGAVVVALVNDEASPLADRADLVVPVMAGVEASVAATKSFVGTLTAIAQVVAAWAGDAPLAAGLAALPGQLDAAWAADWTAALPVLAGAEHLYVVGRGPGFGVAQEAALKFKETCGLHAEAFSTAEVRHGPMTLVGPGFPVFAFVADDASRGGTETAIRAFVGQGATVIAASASPIAGTVHLPVIACHPLLQPIVHAHSFYRLVERLARCRGFDPDRPAHLNKITRTL